MSCFKTQERFNPFASIPTNGPRLISRVSIDPRRPVSAAAASFAAQEAGADLVLLTPGAVLLEPARAIHALREALGEEPVPLAAEMACASGDSAAAIVAAGADKVVLWTEAILNPALVGEVSRSLGSESTWVALGVNAIGPDVLEVLDGAGRKTGLDCVRWANRLASHGAGALILRPTPSMPSEALLELFSTWNNNNCALYVQRSGWSLQLIEALGADGVVADGALGCRILLEDDAFQVSTQPVS